MAIKLPRDANGKEIPLDTKFLYDPFGVKREVVEYKYSPSSKDWTVDSAIDQCGDPSGYFTLDPPDSWEKLLEDIGGTTGHTCWYCVYFKNSGQICSGCPAVSTGDCATAVLDDIARRIRALRGETDGA